MLSDSIAQGRAATSRIELDCSETHVGRTRAALSSNEMPAPVRSAKPGTIATESAPAAAGKGHAIDDATGTLLDRFAGWWLSERQPGMAGHAAFLCCLAAICGATAYIGLPWLFKYSNDLFIFLDGGWRALNGQRAHVDVYTGVGPVTYLVNAAGLWLARLKPDGLGIGTALVGLAIGLAAYRIALPRMRGPAPAVCALMLALVVVAPFVLGDAPIDTAFAVVYNRYGYGILGILVIEAFQPVRDRGRERSERVLGAIANGVCCGILLFLKISFFVAAVPLVLFGWFCWPRERRAAMTAAGAAFLAVCAAFLWYLRFDLRAMWNDLATVAASRHHVFPAIHAVIFSNFELLGLAAVLLLVRAAGGGRPGDPEERMRALRQTAVTGLVLFSGIFLLLTNAQTGGIPLAGLMAILLADDLAGASGAARRAKGVSHAAVVVAALLVAWPGMAAGGISLAYSVARRASTVKTLTPLREPALGGIWFTAEAPVYDTVVYLNAIEDGMALLRARSVQEETVYSLGYSNPFSYVLRRRPAEGGSWCLAYGLVLDERYHPDPDRTLGNADILMVPKDSYDDVDGVLRIYGDYLRSHFRLAAESVHWRMYRNTRGRQAGSGFARAGVGVAAGTRGGGETVAEAVKRRGGDAGGCADARGSETVAELVERRGGVEVAARTCGAAKP